MLLMRESSPVRDIDFKLVPRKNESKEQAGWRAQYLRTGDHTSHAMSSYGLRPLRKHLVFKRTDRPQLPKEHFGFKDQEQRHRHKYLDLIINDKTRDTFITRAKIVRTELCPTLLDAFVADSSLRSPTFANSSMSGIS